MGVIIVVVVVTSLIVLGILGVIVLIGRRMDRGGEDSDRPENRG